VISIFQSNSIVHPVVNISSYKIRLILPALVIMLQLSIKQTFSQSFYDIQTIQNIELFFGQPNWDYMMDTAKAGSGSYILADSIRINGHMIDSVGVKYKGNSSYNPNRVKNPLHIELDHFIDSHLYDGITDIKLNNGFKDPTLTRETVSYNIARTYMAAPRANYARLYINGDYTGLYTNVESVTKKFVRNHFNSNQNAFFKCNPVYSSGSKSNLAYNGSDSTLYYNSYEIKSVQGWNLLVELCNTLKNNTNALNSILDIDRALWMLAFNNILVNLDSYTGAISQNYYLYWSDNGSFQVVIWDLNESFGSFNSTGVGQPLNITQMQQMPPLLHMNYNERPLIQRLLNIPMYKKMYMAHMKTIFQEYINNDLYFTLASSFQQIISSSVAADVNKLYTFNDFTNNLTQSVTSGPMTIPGLKLLMDGRKTYLSNHAEMNYQQPDIQNIEVSDTVPQLNDIVTFRSSVSNAVSVWLGYRYHQFDRFVRVQMFDDGNHDAGPSGDGIYGIQIPVNSAQIQYYIYAENSEAGKFSPERAEYEYYTLNCIQQFINAGEVVLNEIMVLNTSTITDPNGQYEDWIELYNNTNFYVSLNGAYLSDSYTNPYKWQFPINTMMPPNGYLLIWADNDTTQSGLHANFKLSGSGEQVILSYNTGYVIDDISYGQQTEDISWGRYPNGNGAFTQLFPTPLSSNQPLSILPISTEPELMIYPNPASHNIVIVSAGTEINDVKIFDVTGRTVFHRKYFQSTHAEIDIQLLRSGSYIISVNQKNSFKLLKQ
jgi:hypothetical protein